MPIYRDPVLAEIEVFLSASGMTATAFGKLAGRDPTLVHDLRRGRELRHATRQNLRVWITDASADAGASSVPSDVSLHHATAQA